MKIVITLIIAFALLPWGFDAAAQNDLVMKFTISDAQNFAVENFFMTVNAQKDIESSKKKIWETTAIGLPQINGGVDYSYTPQVPKASFPVAVLNTDGIPADNNTVTGNQVKGMTLDYMQGPEFDLGVKQNITYNLMLTQLIFSGEYIIGLQASRTFLRLSEEAYEKTTIELKQLVANSYYTILVLKKNEELLTSTIENFRSISNETKKTAELGLLDKTDADQIEINVKRGENQLRSVQRQLEMMDKVLKYQLGITSTVNVELSDSLSYLVQNDLINVASAYQFNLNDHIDFRLLQTQEDLNLLSLKREKALYLPTVSGFYRYEDKVYAAALDFSIKHMVGVGMDIPIFNSGFKNARVAQARINFEQAELEKTQQSEKLTMEASQSKFDYLTALEKFTNEKENFELSTRILNNNTIKYKAGMISSLDLTLSNNQFLEAQITYSQAILDLLNSKVKMDKSYSKL